MAHRNRYPAVAPITASGSRANMLNRFTSRPSHSSGWVMASGRSCVSASIIEPAIRNHSSAAEATATQVGPKCHKQAPVSTPVTSSTAG